LDIFDSSIECKRVDDQEQGPASDGAAASGAVIDTVLRKHRGERPVVGRSCRTSLGCSRSGPDRLQPRRESRRNRKAVGEVALALARQRVVDGQDLGLLGGVAGTLRQLAREAAIAMLVLGTAVGAPQWQNFVDAGEQQRADVAGGLVLPDRSRPNQASGGYCY